MKKSLIIAVIFPTCAALFTSCTKTEISDSLNDSPIVFQVANYMSQTKAGETAFPINDVFGTYAWTNSANGGAQHQILMDGETVGYTGSTWQAMDADTKAAKNYYWPKSGNVDFISYYPAGECWFDINKDANVISASATISGNTNTTNLMYADKAIGRTYDNSKDGVETLFHHALSQISVIFNTAKDNDGHGVDFEVNVTSAKFTAINTKGSLSMGYTGTTGVWNAPKVWTVDTQSTSDFPMNVGKITTEDKKVINGISVLPQVLESDNKLELEYTVTTKYPKQDPVSEKLTASVALKDLNVSSWELNRKITYTITIDPNGLNPITFLPLVEEWVASEAIEIEL